MQFNLIGICSMFFTCVYRPIKNSYLNQVLSYFQIWAMMPTRTLSENVYSTKTDGNTNNLFIYKSKVNKPDQRSIPSVMYSECKRRLHGRHFTLHLCSAQTCDVYLLLIIRWIEPAILGRTGTYEHQLCVIKIKSCQS